MGDDIIPACLVVMLFENCSVDSINKEDCNPHRRISAGKETQSDKIKKRVGKRGIRSGQTIVRIIY